jgi:hypothetical protein
MYEVLVNRKTHTLNDLAHVVFPRVSLWGVFGDKDKIGSTTRWNG